MKSRPVHKAPWMRRRARVLHGVCTVIEKDRKKGKRARSAYKKAQARWNRSKLAAMRKRFLSVHGIRAIYARWKQNGRTAMAFAPSWKTPDHRKISRQQAVKWTRRIIVQGITIMELYRRLKSERGNLPFCSSTLNLNLPGEALRRVARARRALEISQRSALAVLDARAKGEA